MPLRAAPDADAAREPLIRNNSGSSREDTEEREEDLARGDSDDEGLASTPEVEAPGIFIWCLTLAAGVSGLLFGYDTGVISSTLVALGTDLSHRPLTTLDKSIVTSVTSLLALLASPLAGVLADAWGRRVVVLAAAVLFVLGAVVQAAAASVVIMVLGRGLVGAGVGMGSFVVPLYISELAPAAFRGRLVTVSSLFVTGGQVVAYIAGWLLSARPHGWRWMVGLGAVPAVVQLLALVFLPETPRWLVKAGRREEARRVLARVYGVQGAVGGWLMARKRGAVERVMADVVREVDEEEATVGSRRVARHSGGGKINWRAWWEGIGDGIGELIDVGENRRALIIACMLQGFQQLCGFNSLMYFSATIFALVGFRSPILTSLSIATTNFVFTLVAFHLIDRVGRRRILLLSVPFMAAGLTICAFAFQFVPLDQGSAPSTDDSGSDAGTARKDDIFPNPETSSAIDGPWPTILLLSMVLYVAAYALGLGNVPWQQSELFALPVRALGSSLATMTNWSANFVVGITFLPMIVALGPVVTFGLYAAVCVGGWLVTWTIYPETAGLGLEEVRGLLAGGWGIRESEERWARRRR